MREILYQQIKEQGNKIYVLSKDHTWTYDDLERHCAFFHAEFRDKGYRRILLSTNQNFYAYSALLAAYLTGCTFCVINPELPIERKQYMVDTFEPHLILCSDKDTLSGHSNVDTFQFEQTESLIAEFKVCPIEHLYDNHLLYVSFTSGSTGMPKGCKIKREAFEKFCVWASDEFSLSENDVYGQYVPLYFDMSLIDIFGGTLHGVTLVPFSKFSHKLRPGLLLKEYQITFLNIVPQFLNILIQTHHFTKDYLKSLRMIRFGGDKIYKKRLDELFSMVPDLKVISTYGPTETTCFCFYKKLDRSTYEKHSQDIATIGNTIPGWHAYLKNVKDNVGEIVIYGPYIGEGYLHDDQDHHYGREIIHNKEEEVYYTGDYAAVINGEYYFEGRRDSQVKINGNRVSLAEVEYAFMNMGCNEAAAVFISENIFCFYCMDQNNFGDESDIKKHLERQLPRYAIPSALINLPKLPYNHNGKIDRQNLKQLAKQHLIELEEII